MRPSGGGSVHATEGRYHALQKEEQSFCAAKVLSRPCIRWVSSVDFGWSDEGPFRPADRGSTFLSRCPFKAGCRAVTAGIDVDAKLLAARLKTRLHDAFWPAITFTRPAGWRSSDRRRGLAIDRGETVMPSIRIINALAALAAASTSAGGQDWPCPPSTLVYPFSPGSAAHPLMF